MPDLSYAYMPVYGVEPYLDNGGLGGAVVTGDNLVITAWQTTGKLGTPPDYADFGPILKPAAVNTALPDAARVAGQSFANSRHSSMVYINGDLGAAAEPINAMGLVLNPPPEVKQLLAGAVSYNGGNPADLASYTVTKSLQAQYAWRFLAWIASAHNAPLNTIAGTFYSTYLFYNDTAFDVAGRVPFLKTNGANGVIPTFFDVSLASGVNQMVEAVNDGDGYYIFFSAPVQTDDEDPEGNYLDITYPHSAARG